MPRAVSQKSAITRDRIVDAAYELFIQKGFNATSMREIVEQGGITMGGIYNHFSSKEEIWTEVLLKYHPYPQILSAIQVNPAENTAELVRSAANALVIELNKRPDLLHLMFIEIVEFNSCHIPLLYDRVIVEVSQLAPLIAGRMETLRKLPPMIIVRAFAGLFFSYYVTGHLLGKQHALTFNQADLNGFVDIFLYGILTDADPARQAPAQPGEETV